MVVLTAIFRIILPINRTGPIPMDTTIASLTGFFTTPFSTALAPPWGFS